MFRVLPVLAAAVTIGVGVTPGQQPCPTPYPPTYYPGPYPPAYQPGYPVQKVIANDIALAPLIVTVPVDSKAIPVHAFGNPNYYSVGDAYREKAYMRDAVKEAVRDELKALLGGQTTAPQPVAQQPRAEQQKAPVGQPAGDTDEPDTTTPQELQQKVLAAYAGRSGCVNCHTGAAAQGPKGKPYRLVSDDGKLLKKSSEKRARLYLVIIGAQMPPGSDRDPNKTMEAAHLPAIFQYAAQKD